MSRFRITLALLATSLWGQSADLAGEWRRSTDDQTDYSRPDFDDRAWETIRLPWSNYPPAGIYWLRRSVDLPPGIDPSQAALTLGPVAEVYEVFVNGVRIAQAGVFRNRFAAQMAQSRTFAIPPEVIGISPRRLQVAIRLERVFTRGLGTSFAHYQDGSYVITEAASAPQRENEWLFAQRKLRLATYLATGSLLLASGLLFFLLWLYQPREVELFWLALLAASRGAFDTIMYAMSGPDTHPGFGWNNLAHAVNGAALAQLILSAAGLRSPWLRVGFWLPWALYYVLTLSQSVGSRAVYLDSLAFALLFFGWWRKTGGRADWTGWLTFGSLTLAVLAHGNATFRFVYFTGWSPVSSSMLILSGLLVFLTMRRLNQDRREKERLAGELEAARLVQNLLLSPPVDAPGLAIVEAVYQPANEVGGDFHWTRLEPDGSLLAVVGDVSGKGLKAAMLVSVVIGILRNEKSGSPAAILAALNNGLTGHTGGGFVTCCCARFGLDGQTTLANAGHPSPYCDGRELDVEAGLPLGIARAIDYPEFVTRGGSFTFVSDGVVEAENAQRELFGFDRTREISTKSAREIAEAAKAWGQNDDITVVTVRRKA